MSKIKVSLLCALLLACRPGREPVSSAPEPLDLELEGPGLLASLDSAGESPPYRSEGFLRLGALWDAEDPAGLELRVSRDGTSWSGWARPIEVFAEGPIRAGHVDLEGEWFQFRVPQGAAPPTFLALDPIRQLGEPKEEVLPELPPGPGVHRQALVAIPEIHPRSAWGARAPTCSSPTTPNRAVVHHTVTPTTDTMTPEQRLRAIQTYHMDSRGYCDIGYNFVVSRDGRAWTARGPTVLGAHTANNNSGNVGISYMGTHTADTITQDQLCTGAGLLSYLNVTWPVVTLDRDTVKGHRQYGSTECPGDALYGQLDAMVAAASSGNGCAPYSVRFAGVVEGRSFSGPIALEEGQSAEVWFDVKNTGSETWTPGKTMLASVPREAPSPLWDASWSSATRAATVSASTAPGAVGRFAFRVSGAAGRYSQRFGLVEEGTAWFADAPLGGGPPESAFALEVEISAPTVPPDPPEPVMLESLAGGSEVVSLGASAQGCGCGAGATVGLEALLGLALALRRRRAVRQK